MRSLFTGLVVMTLAALSGCNQGTPGGQGTTEKKPAFGQADNTFNLSVPDFSSSLQQGKQTEATVGIKRAKKLRRGRCAHVRRCSQGRDGRTRQPRDQARRHRCEDYVQGRG